MKYVKEFFLFKIQLRKEEKHMKTAKRALSVLLAFMLAFGAFGMIGSAANNAVTSIAASADSGAQGKMTFGLNILKNGTALGDGDTLSPGDVVDVQLKIGTDFYLGFLSTEILYDSDYFEPYLDGAAYTTDPGNTFAPTDGKFFIQKMEDGAPVAQAANGNSYSLFDTLMPDASGGLNCLVNKSSNVSIVKKNIPLYMREFVKGVQKQANDVAPEYASLHFVKFELTPGTTSKAEGYLIKVPYAPYFTFQLRVKEGADSNGDAKAAIFVPIGGAKRASRNENCNVLLASECDTGFITSTGIPQWGQAIDCADADYSFVIGEAPCAHEWGEWTSISDTQHERECSLCHTKETEDHNLSTNTVDATCTTGGSTTTTCSVCGYQNVVNTDPTGHSFTNYVSNNDATCDADGTKTATCDNGCGTTDTIADVGSALGHSFTNYVSNNDATCTADGTKTATCDNGCGTTDTIVDEGSKLGHSFTNYVSNNDATCTEDGTKTATCDNGCGTTDTIADEGSKLGHDFPDTWEQIEGDAENHIHTCTRCDATETAAHEFDIVNTPATCTEAGSITYTCSDCGYTYTVDGDPATGHDWESWEYLDEDNHERFCSKNDGGHEIEAHDWVEDTTLYVEPDEDTEGQIVYNCSKCGEQKIVTLPKHVHTFGEWTKAEGDAEFHYRSCGQCDKVESQAHTFDIDETPASCTADGQKVYTCSVCGFSYTETLSATGHSFTNYVSDGNATCTADGTKTAKCDRCDVTDTIADEGSAKGHSFTNYVSNNDATCTADGTKTATCDNGCGTTNTIADEGSAKGHSFTNYVSDGNATCTADGTKTATCDNGCGETDTIADEGSKLGHSFTNYVSNNDATCTADGTKTATCDNGCGTIDTIADEGSKLGHSFTNYVSNNDATCTADGTKTATCDNGCGTTDTIADEGSKLGHSFTNYVSNNDATCTADGTKTAKCDRCDATDTIADEGTKLGHSFTNYVSNNDATCTADGTKTAKCDRCDATDTIADEGTKLGHDFGAWTDNGDNHKRECSRCDAVETAEHTYGEWTETKPATEKEEGEKEHTCTVCGHKETETIEKLAPVELTLTENIGNTTGNVVALTATYSRRNAVAATLTASEEGVKYTIDAKGSKILKIDENGNIKFVRLSLFTRTAVITATSEDGARTATCQVTVKLKWWQYLVWLIFGCLWF